MALWQAWQNDPQRPQHLSVSATLAAPVPADRLACAAHPTPQMQALADALRQAARGCVPGVHRLVFEGGRVRLTLHIGPPLSMLREMDVAADELRLNPPVPAPPSSAHPLAQDPTSTDLNRTDPNWADASWADPNLPKALARLCRPGTHLHASACPPQAAKDWQSCGFVLQHSQQPPPPPTLPEPPTPTAQPGAVFVARFAPTWVRRSALRQAAGGNGPRTVLVIGAGLSGAAVACSLAQRGWAVSVLDAGAAVGAGASGLPVGLTAPHTSPDDHPLSRITRAGVRATLGRCQQLGLGPQDWGLTGVLTHNPDGTALRLPAHADTPGGADWGQHAQAQEHLLPAGLPADAHALWHPLAAWIRPAALAAAQLQTAGVQVLWGQAVATLAQTPQGWAALDAAGHTLGQAAHVVVASGWDSLALLPRAAALPLHALRGQISMGPLHALPASAQAALPPTPVNGRGSFICGPALPEQAVPGWFAGASFERGCSTPLLRPQDHAHNLHKLAQLLPHLSGHMHSAFAGPAVMGWAGVRCTLPDRLPAVGPIDTLRWPGLHVCTGMGARGLSVSVLCAELLAAHLQGEPLPLSPTLAKHLWACRFAPAPPSGASSLLKS